MRGSRVIFFSCAMVVVVVVVVSSSRGDRVLGMLCDDICYVLLFMRVTATRSC